MSILGLIYVQLTLNKGPQMQIGSVIDKKTGVIIHAVTGEIHFEKIRSSSEKPLKLPSYAKLFPVLWDIRNANLLKINEQDFIKISNYYQRQSENHTILKSALVVADDFEFRLLRLFELYMANMPIEIQAFKKIEDAKEWLSK